MKSLFIHKSSFSMLLICSSIFLVLSSNNLFFSWLMMEFNLMSFLVFLYSRVKSGLKKEVKLKYFILQASASLVLMFSLAQEAISGSSVFNNLIFLSLIFKLGLAPFHQWYFSIMVNMDWTSFAILSSLQKILPLIVVSSFNWSKLFLLLVGSLNCLVGALLSYNLSCLRTLSGVSSLFFYPILIILSPSSDIFMFFLLSYASFNFLISIYLHNLNVYYYEDLLMKNFSLFSMLLLFLLILTSGGLPPTAIFFMKYNMLKYILPLSSASSIFFFLYLISSLWFVYCFINMSVPLIIATSFKKMIIHPHWEKYSFQYVLVLLLLNILVLYFL